MLCHALTGSLPLFLTGLNILKQVSNHNQHHHHLYRGLRYAFKTFSQGGGSSQLHHNHHPPPSPRVYLKEKLVQLHPIIKILLIFLFMILTVQMLTSTMFRRLSQQRRPLPSTNFTVFYLHVSHQKSSISVGLNIHRLYFKKVALNNHFLRPAESDPYASENLIVHFLLMIFLMCEVDVCNVDSFCSFL